MTGLQDTFNTLRSAMLAVAGELPRVSDTDDHLYLNTNRVQANKKPLFFGAVQIKKRAVSYHLMPLYTHPELLERISPKLKKQMQGKSCFNLSEADPALIGELAALTKYCFETYRKAGHL